MPFVLIIVGIFLFVSAVRGTSGQLATLLKNDLTGSGSFLYWFVAILVIGGIGYIPALKKLSDAFLVLVILALFVANRGFFSQFNTALKQISSGSQNSPANTLALTNPFIGTSSLTGATAIPQGNTPGLSAGTQAAWAGGIL
jgi:hypothetical protein